MNTLKFFFFMLALFGVAIFANEVRASKDLLCFCNRKSYRYRLMHFVSLEQDKDALGGLMEASKRFDDEDEADEEDEVCFLFMFWMEVQGVRTYYMPSH
jgi:hypothetical protein